MPGTVRILLMVASCACSGTSTTGPTTPPPPADAARAPSDLADRPATPQQDRAQCERLTKHAVELALAEQPPTLTPEEQATLERDVAAAYVPACSKLPASVIECALGATTLEGLAACSGNAQELDLEQ